MKYGFTAVDDSYFMVMISSWFYSNGEMVNLNDPEPPGSHEIVNKIMK